MGFSAFESHAAGARHKKLIGARKWTVDISDKKARSDKVNQQIEALANSKAQ